MFLSQSNLNAMNFRNPLAKQCQTDMNLPSFGVPINKVFGSMPCFRDSRMGTFRKSVEESLCKSYPIGTGLGIASGGASRISFTHELPSLDSMIAELVNTFEQAMPSHEGPVQIIDFQCLGVMNLPEAKEQDNSFQLKSFMYSMGEKKNSPRVGLTYAQVTKLPPCPQKVFAKLQNFPVEPVCKSQSINISSQGSKPFKKPSPCKQRVPQKITENKVKIQFPISISKKVVESPLCNEAEMRKDIEVGNKRLHKSKGKKKRRKGRRELGGKGMNQRSDPDGSVWASQNMDNSLAVPFSPPAVKTSFSSCISPLNKEPLVMKTSVGGLDLPRRDSESSEEPPVCKPIARLRSLSDCSVGSLDSEDSFIVFASDNGTEENCDDISDCTDSDSEEDEVDFVCDWKSRCRTAQSSPDSQNTSPNAKRVRFSENVVVHPMVVWSCALRLARPGPWEQMARDRARFACRIAEAGKTLAPILDPKHRAAVYGQRFSAA